MNTTTRALLGATALCAAATFAQAQDKTTLTIATVNNGDMIRMQGLTDDFESKNPDIALEWVTLEENVLRQRVTTDIATKGGQYDVMTIGTYEVPIWGKQGWLTSLNDLPAEWDKDDHPAGRSHGGLTVDGELYAAPFYGESSMVMYRTGSHGREGRASTMLRRSRPGPTSSARPPMKMTDKPNEIYGICLRGKAGWGENMAFLTAMNEFSFGAASGSTRSGTPSSTSSRNGRTTLTFLSST